jgi:LysR family glycine cleavage system transcriptional activator
MSSRLPPLTALRAFEAAARHMSFAKAAEELSVTPAALSFQIKSLEDHLGAALFNRLNRAVSLTEAGSVLAPGCRAAFSELSAAWAATLNLQDTVSLTITAGPAFTAKWLAPRLFEFAQTHPEIELQFAATLRLMDFNRDEVDVAVRFGYGPDPGLYSLPLAQEWVTPVMTPELARRFPTIESLRDATLIIDQSIDFLKLPCSWENWFHAVEMPPITAHGPKFSQADHAIDASLAGVGVTLGRRSLVIKDLMEGRLVAPYGLALDTGARFRFLCQEGAENQPKITAFRDWMLREIKKGAYISETLDILPVSAGQK